MILEIKYNFKVSNSSRVGESTGCVIGILDISPRASFKYHTIKASDFLHHYHHQNMTTIAIENWVYEVYVCMC